jgi:hypothetical protein
LFSAAAETRQDATIDARRITCCSTACEHVHSPFSCHRSVTAASKPSSPEKWAEADLGEGCLGLRVNAATKLARGCAML